MEKTLRNGLTAFVLIVALALWAVALMYYLRSDLGFKILSTLAVLIILWVCVVKAVESAVKLVVGTSFREGRWLGRFSFFVLTRTFAIVVLLLAKVCWLMYFSVSGEKLLENQERDDLLGRRNYLLKRVVEERLELSAMPGPSGAPILKEFAIVTLSMSAAALTNMSFRYPELRQESLGHVEKMIARMLEPDLRSYEIDIWGEDALDSLDGPLPHIGYLAHLNFMLAAYRILGGDGRYDKLFHDITGALARRLRASGIFYLRSYPDQIFVPDNVVVFASLALHRKIFSSDMSDIFHGWREYTKKHLLDPQTGLISPLVTVDGKAWGPSRGSFSSWNAYYLPFFDADFARTLYQRLRKHMLMDLPFGGMAIREYAVGVEGRGDVNSGPVVFGMSTSGTGFATSGASYHKDAEVLQGLLITAEFVGSTVGFRDHRHYLFAPLVGEACILAMKTTRPWDLRYLANVEHKS